jgi:hypothetical protein
MCTQLVTVTLGEQLKIIGEKAYEECTSRRDIVIPARVKVMQDWAFDAVDHCGSWRGAGEDWGGSFFRMHIASKHHHTPCCQGD